MSRPYAGLWLAAALLAAAPPAAALAQALAGFGLFKFGMSPEQARALPGQSFGRYAVDERNTGAMGSKNPASVYGIPFGFYLFFNSFKSLDRIGLQNETTTDQGACEKRFLTVLAQLEKTHGALAPVYPEHARNNADLLPISIVWKKTSGPSRYQLATVFLSGETASVWQARKSYGRRALDISTAWSAEQPGDQAVCLTQLDFTA